MKRRGLIIFILITKPFYYFKNKSNAGKAIHTQNGGIDLIPKILILVDTLTVSTFQFLMSWLKNPFLPRPLTDYDFQKLLIRAPSRYC